jgi:hypothetical protein
MMMRMFTHAIVVELVLLLLLLGVHPPANHAGASHVNCSVCLRHDTVVDLPVHPA